MSDQELINLDLPARPPFVALARDAVFAVASELGLPEHERDALRLAVGEACNNAVLHGSEDTRMAVRCRRVGDQIVIEVENEGGFAPGAPAEMPDPAAEGGRGRALMEALADGVEYRVSLAKTLVRLRKTLPGDR